MSHITPTARSVLRCTKWVITGIWFTPGFLKGLRPCTGFPNPLMGHGERLNLTGLTDAAFMQPSLLWMTMGDGFTLPGSMKEKTEQTRTCGRPAETSVFLMK